MVRWKVLLTLSTRSISFKSTFFAKTFISTFPPPPSPSSSPISSAATPPSTPSPPIFPSRPQNSTNAFSLSISSNARLHPLVRSRCHFSYSCSSSPISYPNFVAGGEESSNCRGNSEKGVARLGVFERKRVCKFWRCFKRSCETWLWKRWSCWFVGSGESMKRGSVLSWGSTSSQVIYRSSG